MRAMLIVEGLLLAAAATSAAAQTPAPAAFDTRFARVTGDTSQTPVLRPIVIGAAIGAGAAVALGQVVCHAGDSGGGSCPIEAGTVLLGAVAGGFVGAIIGMNSGDRAEDGSAVLITPGPRGLTIGARLAL